MNKTKSKVLSLILASAMIVSSFSSLNFASAAKSSETGRLTVDSDELYLASNTSDNSTTIDELLGNVSLKTYDNEEVSDAEFVSFTHASGDRLIKSVKDNKDNDVDDVVTLKDDAQGKEVITVTYEGEYDRDDKTVTVRAKKDITIYADPVGAQIVGDTGFSKDAGTDKPDDVATAAINDADLQFAIYKVTNQGLLAKYEVDTNSTDNGAYKATVKKEATKSFAVEKNDVLDADAGVYTIPTKYYDADDADKNKADVTVPSGDKSNVMKDTEALDAALADLEIVSGTTTGSDAAAMVKKLASVNVTGSARTAVTTAQTKIDAFAGYLSDLADTPVNTALQAYKDAKEAADDAIADAKTALADVKNNTAEKFADDGYINLEIPLLTGDKDDSDDTEKTTVKISVEKKWRAEGTSVEVNKKGGTTYITRGGSVSWDSDDWKNVDKKKDVYAVSSYAIAAPKDDSTSFSITVKDGKLGAILGNAKTSVKVEDGTVGDIKANSISIEDGSVGTLKQKGTSPEITVTDGKVKAIDADASKVTVNGGTVSGDIKGDTVTIDSNDEDVPTTISGNIEAKNESNPTVEIGSSSDAAVKVTGTVKGEVTLNDEFVTIGTIDADYENEINFDDFSGKVGSVINAYDVDVTVTGESNVILSGKLEASNLDIEDEDGKITIGEGSFDSISGDGTLAVPAGKLFIEDSMEDITLQLTTGLVAGATAFTAYTDAVDVDDFATLGYTLEQKAANSDTDKFVIKAVTFAGVQLDKTELSIAKGQESTVTAVAYPTGTSLPTGYSVDWSVDANDDYISVTTEGNVATVKVLDYNADYATDNQATLTATVVDADGNESDDYVAATVKVTATALPTSTVTLDTTKPVTVGTGAVYQYIAKSSTGAVMSAASSDTQIATVELFNAADPRGYKFQVKGVAEGTATITTTDANGATATLTVNVVKVNGTLKADTTTYTFAPGKVYDVKFSTTGTTAVPVVTVNGKVVSIAPRGNGVYRVTAQNPGTAYVVATVGNTHVSVKFVVANGAASVGVKGNNVSTLK